MLEKGLKDRLRRGRKTNPFEGELQSKTKHAVPYCSVWIYGSLSAAFYINVIVICNMITLEAPEFCCIAVSTLGSSPSIALFVRVHISS